jgi:hypothetical protein
MEADVVSSGSSVRMTLSGNGAKSPVIRVPLLVRSNVAFRICASAQSKAAVLTQLSVVDVRATGRLVSSEAIRELEIPQQFDMRGRKEKDPSEKEPSILDASRPFLLLSGPRVSLGGTRQSQNNALQISVLMRITNARLASAANVLYHQKRVNRKRTRVASWQVGQDAQGQLWQNAT